MRSVMLLMVSVLMIVTMAVSPALAHDRGDGDWGHDGWSERDGVWVVFVPFVFFSDIDVDGIEDSSDCDFIWCEHEDFAFDDCEWEWSWVFEEWEIEC